MSKSIRIEDKMPRNYEDVLLYIPSHGKIWFYYGVMCVGSYNPVRKCFCMDSVSINALYEIEKPLDLVTSYEASQYLCNFEPSHWKKLPKRPYADYETVGYRVKWFFKGIYYRIEFHWKKFLEQFG